MTQKWIESDARVPATGRVDYHDALMPGLALRVSKNGNRSFVLIARYPGNTSRNPTRRSLGQFGPVTLQEARDRAKEWLTLIDRGRDPSVVEEQKRAVEIKKLGNSFAVVAKEFLERHATGLAKYGDIKHTIEAEFSPRWENWPITDITSEQVAVAIRAIVKRGAKYQAANAFGYLRRLFSWAIGTHEFGVTVSPCERLKPANLVGTLEVRERILTDVELRAVWKASAWEYKPVEGKRVRSAIGAPDMGYPYGPLIRMLVLTGLREREVAEMAWDEVDLDAKLWTVPALRMKGKRAHQVPLAPDALALLKSLPRFKGPHVFTTTDGEKPVDGFSKAKVRIDKLCGVEKWKFHDIRRTMRTHLSALPVQDIVREMILAHARPGLHKVYDLHLYQAEKRECLELWERRLKLIVDSKETKNATE